MHNTCCLPLYFQGKTTRGSATKKGSEQSNKASRGDGEDNNSGSRKQRKRRRVISDSSDSNGEVRQKLYYLIIYLQNMLK